MNPFKSLNRRSALGIITAFAGLTCTMTPAAAAEFPTKAVTMIIPYGAGGSTDTMGRVFANALGNELGQPVVVVNRKGGGGSVGASFLKNSAPDGYTILMGGVDEITAWNAIASEVDFSASDFRFIGAVANYQNAFVAPAGQPFSTFGEFVEHAKANPGLPVVSQGGMSATFLDIVAEKEALDLRVVNANSGSEAMQLLIAGNAVMSYSGGSHANYADQIQVLASLNDTRLSGYPDALTFKESGYGLNMPSLVGVMAPSGVSDEVAAALENALLAAAQDTDFLTIVEERLKSKVQVLSGAEVQAAIDDMAFKYKDIASR